MAGIATGERLLCSVVDGVATLRLNKPDRLNAIDHGPGSLQRELVDTMAALDADDDVRCFIITGSGRAFCAGGELGAAKELRSASDWHRFLAMEDEDNERIRALDKPVIGAINGICYGAGLIMAAHFDFLVASGKARFGMIETRFGGTGVDVLGYLVGPQWAKFLAISGELISADKAKEIGLVLEVVPDAEFPDRIADLGRRIASMPRRAVENNRRVVNGVMHQMGWEQQKELALALNSVTNESLAEAEAADGRRFSDLLKEGWAEYKAARDAPFAEPWLKETTGA
jgi:enoyl-CoA hydratase/carnithine racemase